MKIADIASSPHTFINPNENKSTTFVHFSLPAFDAGKKPVIEKGESILSGKFVVSNDVILYNKLNIKFRRIWNVKQPPKHSICSSEFIPIVVKDNACNQDYLYYYLCSDHFTNIMLGHVSGTSNSQQRIQPQHLFSQEICLPNSQIQKHIVDTVC